MPKYFFALLYMAFFCIQAKAQFTDDFSDGNFTEDPVWSGTSNHFIINTNKQLQLSNSGAGESYLTTPSKTLKNTTWEFWVRLAFSPSGTNFARIYLAADKADLSKPLKGFYIHIGEAGSLDGIDLFKQDSITHTKLIDGRAGRASKTNNILRIKITCNDSGLLTLYIDSVGGTNFTRDGQVTDNFSFNAQYFGVYAKYTSTNATKFYWDDFKVEKIFIDTVPPKLISVNVLSNSSLQLFFSEEIDSTSVSDTLNYSVNNSIGNPSAAVVSADKKSVTLTFTKAFSAGVPYVVETKNIADTNGNKALNQTVEFFIPLPPYQPIFGDVIFNELFPDPTPPVNLPEAEFFELYNASDQPIALGGWTITDGTSTGTFPNDTINPGAYIIVTGNASVAQFSGHGKVVGLSTFPSLNNSGDNIILRSKKGEVIDRVNYSDAWYKNSTKASGGWTLERISLTDSCKGADNWSASNDSNGGTPGRQNSIFTSVADTIAPVILAYKVLDSSTLEVNFTEAFDTSAIQVKINPVLPVSNLHISADKKMLTLKFAQAFAPNINYVITVSELKDCIGNTAPAQQIFYSFIPPEKAGIFDVLITEIMAEPGTNTPLPNFEYVEIFNRSNKKLNLKNWTFSDANTKATITTDYFLLPDSFVILTPDAAVNQFLTFTKNIIGLKSWPSLNNSSDSLFLRNNEAQLVNFVAYSSSWHTDDLKKTGWSLEMIDTKNPCITNGNWASSRDNSGGTPSRKNSVYGTVTDKTSPVLKRVLVKDSITLELIFSEALDASTASDLSNYNILPYIGMPKNASVLEPAFNKVVLQFAKPMEYGLVYSLSVSRLTDCAGNKMHEAEWRFGKPQMPDSFDVVINEILFNPNPNAYDFIEIYNRGNKNIDVGALLISSADENNAVRNPKNIPAAGYILIPGAYMALTENASVLKNKYYVPDADAVIEMSLPAFNDDEGKVVLLRKDGLRLDQLNYNDNWHFELLNSTEGVSLEKRNPDLPTQQQSSWHSAASTVGYATPTYQNSQFVSRENFNEQAQHFSITKPIFSPDNDGYEDVLEIAYKMPEPGYVASINIFDVNGRKINSISANQLLSTQGIITWNGLTDAGNKANIGVYIILIEAFHPNGKTIQQKLSCTLAGRL